MSWASASRKLRSYAMREYFKSGAVGRVNSAQTGVGRLSERRHQVPVAAVPDGRIQSVIGRCEEIAVHATRAVFCGKKRGRRAQGLADNDDGAAGLFSRKKIDGSNHVLSSAISEIIDLSGGISVSAQRNGQNSAALPLEKRNQLRKGGAGGAVPMQQEKRRTIAALTAEPRPEVDAVGSLQSMLFQSGRGDVRKKLRASSLWPARQLPGSNARGGQPNQQAGPDNPKQDPSSFLRTPWNDLPVPG
jgi:hypothetical protein